MSTQEPQALERRTSFEDTGLSTTTQFSTELAPTAAAAEKQFEIQSAIVLARRFQRDEDQAFAKLLKTCKRTSFAEDAEYSFPRGNIFNEQTKQWEKNFVTGPSVNVAREAARVWGNIRYGIDVVRDDEQSRSIRGWAWDLETNTKVQSDDDFKKLVFRKGKNGAPGSWIPADERELRELTNRRGAILVRNCLLQILPRDLIEDAVDQCRETLKSNVEKDPEGEKKKVIKAFSDLNITPEMLAAYLGHKLDQSSPAEIASLRQVFGSIRDGNTTWADYVNGNSEAAAADLKDKTKAKTADLKEKLSGEKKTEVPDEKKEIKARKASIKKKYEELGWSEDEQDRYQGGKDINAYSLAELDQLNRSLTEKLAE
jgi:hypothetical protein